ncbi:hypothetical protein VaNZ11_008270 [Volvox africanus]|uniref:ditrans,polycis-polyprenyl diphosphate synthase [(2E,6E)-farnesyldiphosphate specific] n=1 Tax=Volvox africanus TaxID=51714 RepID=A0ABQ5S5V8_9CHLO|nr:hypothetical protein VaNZ11_008270 [Volvox africanus]
MFHPCRGMQYIHTSGPVSVECSMLTIVFSSAIFVWLHAIVRWFFGEKKTFSEHTPTPNMVYRGSRPDPPTAVAVIWAEEKMDDAAIKQLANIMQWCDHEALQTFCLYDPSGELKSNVQQLKCELLDQKWVVQIGWRPEPLAQELLCKTCRAAQDPANAVCSATVGVHALSPQAGPVPLSPPAEMSSVVAAPITIMDRAGSQASGAAPTSGWSQCQPAAAAGCDGCVIGLKPSNRSTADCGTLAHGCSAAASSPGGAEATAAASPPECAAGAAAGGCNREGCEGASGKSGVRIAARWEHPLNVVAKAAAPDGCGADAVKAEDGGEGERRRHRLDTVADAVVRGTRMQRQGAATEVIGEVQGCLQDCSGLNKGPDQIGDVGNDLHITSGSDRRQLECPAQAATLTTEDIWPCGRRVQAHVLSAEDGYAPVLSVARTGGVCSSCGTFIRLKSGTYREGLLRLRSQMAELAGPAVLVQPELVLVVGPVLTLAGFPPLQVAASEILYLGPSRGLNRARVDAALAKFLRTEQRFGS